MIRLIPLLLSSFFVFSQAVLPPPPTTLGSWTEEQAQAFCEWQGFDGEKDPNREHVSDPFIKALSGEIRGKVIADFGSGCGYLSRRYAEAGALKVFALEPSHWMNVVAKKRTPEKYLKVIEFLEEDGRYPASIKPNSVDLVISNYVLMDVSSVDAHARAMHGVLVPGGKAIIVVLHPIYSLRIKHSDLSKAEHLRAYFQKDIVNVTLKGMPMPIWVHHQWVSDYIHSFAGAGLDLADFEEPHLTDAQRRLHGLSDDVGSEPTSMILVFKKKPNESKERVLNTVINPGQRLNTDIRTELRNRVICKKFYGTPNWQSTCMKSAIESGIDVKGLSYAQLVTTAFIVSELLKSSLDYEMLFNFFPLAYDTLQEAIGRLNSVINEEDTHLNSSDLEMLKSAKNYFSFQGCQLLQKSGPVLKYTFGSYHPWIGLFSSILLTSHSAYRSRSTDRLLGSAVGGFLGSYFGLVGLTWISKPLRIAYGRDEGCDCTSCETDKSHSVFHDALRLVDLER